jgi:hypothetical protein
VKTILIIEPQLLDEDLSIQNLSKWDLKNTPDIHDPQ